MDELFHFLLSFSLFHIHYFSGYFIDCKIYPWLINFYFRLVLPRQCRDLRAFKLSILFIAIEIIIEISTNFWYLRREPLRTSLVAQWLRIRLPMQGTWVWSLVWEDPTCCGATKPACRNYWACTLESTSHNYWARVPQLLKPLCLESVLCNKRSHRNEKPAPHDEE